MATQHVAGRPTHEAFFSQTPRGGPEVGAFMTAMLNELDVNAHKGPWRKIPREVAAYEIVYHAIKLCIALREEHRAAILEYAADTANACMMAAHVYSALDVSLLNDSRAEVQPGVNWRVEIPMWKRRTRGIVAEVMSQRVAWWVRVQRFLIARVPLALRPEARKG